MFHDLQIVLIFNLKNNKKMKKLQKDQEVSKEQNIINVSIVKEMITLK